MDAHMGTVSAAGLGASESASIAVQACPHVVSGGWSVLCTVVVRDLQHSAVPLRYISIILSRLEPASV